uniref:Uncharacterized protein n=1 Tax=Anguilla anguilla TaxID=7936 RepID=A0A0E9UNB4_ANGAN
MKMLTYPCHGCGACIEYSVFVEAAFCRSLFAARAVQSKESTEGHFEMP